MMKSWCRKATVFAPRCILSFHSLHKPNAVVPRAMGIPSYLHHSSRRACQPQFLFLGHTYATKSNGGIYENNTKMVDLEIISRESIKPASPTPHHLKILGLTPIDQLINKYYSHVTVFLPNTDKASVSYVTKIRSRRLKESLSELLTHYYPFAGEIVDNIHIECNDKGVFFVEARVNQTLEEFLGQPDDQKVRELNPKQPNTTESSLGNYIASVQVNIFNCGGISLSTSVTHKIVDGYSYLAFIKAWAAVAKGLSPLPPSFVASKIFPATPSLKDSLPLILMTNELLSTRRFVFDSKALASLKAHLVACTRNQPSRGPTRTEATTTLIWKGAAKAAATVRPFGPESPHALLTMVNLRRRASPPFSNESIGNIIDAAVAICFPNQQPDISTLMGEVRESIAKVNSDYIESVKGVEGHAAIIERAGMMNGLMNSIDEGDCLIVSSLLNSRLYDIDFGWGKPIWVYIMNPGNPRIVYFNDVKKGGGLEAIVSLSASEMEIFERDSEILSYATLDPSPLQLID